MAECFEAMDKFLVPCLLSFLCGMFGYVVARLQFMPIYRYWKIKRKISSRLVFYDNGEIADENREALRRYSAAMSSCRGDLPAWYGLLISNRGESPDETAKHLVTLANTNNPEHAAKRVESVRRSMRIE